MNQKLKVKSEFFRDCLYLAHLTKNKLEELATIGKICHFKKGDIIFQEGDPPKFFYLVMYGKVKLSKASPRGGKSFFVYVASRCNGLNVGALFGDIPHIVSAQAMDDVAVFAVEQKDFLRFVEENPDVATKLITRHVELVSSLYERIVDLTGMSVNQRIRNVLLTLSSRFGDCLSFTSSEIGELAGTTTETAIRELSRLKGLGGIRTGRRMIIIVDRSKLYDIDSHSYII